jgi:hypothetical protein
VLALVVASILTQSVPWGTGESQGEDLIITLATFGPGESLESWWGHSAMVVEDRRLRQARLYNYGMFDFSTGFVHKFVQGRLEFWVADTEYVGGTYEAYRHYNRDVRLQELNLTPAQRVVLAKSLADNVLPQNRDYLYHHYNDNCSTRPRNLIDQALGGQLLKATSVPARMSLRKQTRRYSYVSAPMSLVLDYLQNDELDRPITEREEAFLPDELERQLDRLKIVGPDGTLQPAVARKTYYYEAKNGPKVPENPPEWTLNLLLVGCAIGGFGFALTRWNARGGRLPRFVWGSFNALIGLVWGSLGVFLFVVGLFTNHTVAHRNENLFLINPFTFAALPLGVMMIFGSKRAGTGLRWTWSALAVTALLGLLAKALPMFDQQNWNLIALVLPVSVAMAASLWLDHRRGAPALPVT